MEMRKRITTFGLIIAPILSLYTTNILSFTFFDVFLLVLAVLLLFRTRYLVINKAFIIFATMIFIQHILVVIVGNIDVGNTTLLMVCYFFFVLFLYLFSIYSFDCQFG